MVFCNCSIYEQREKEGRSTKSVLWSLLLGNAYAKLFDSSCQRVHHHVKCTCQMYVMQSKCLYHKYENFAESCFEPTCGLATVINVMKPWNVLLWWISSLVVGFSYAGLGGPNTKLRLVSNHVYINRYKSPPPFISSLLVFYTHINSHIHIYNMPGIPKQKVTIIGSGNW